MSILCKTPSIREVIAFPKTGVGADLMFESPAPARQDVLGQYGIGIAGRKDAPKSANDDGEESGGTCGVETQLGTSSGPSTPRI